jgi:hypothetical protein
MGIEELWLASPRPLATFLRSAAKLSQGGAFTAISNANKKLCGSEGCRIPTNESRFPPRRYSQIP